MKHITLCMECIREHGEQGRETIVANYFEDAVSYVTCSKNHKSAVVLQSFKFEILLESAAYSLLDGYTLEAASSLSAAYERTFEFALNVMAKVAGIDKDAYSQTFKQMSKKSEQQIGAFLVLYASTFRKPYKVLSEISEFRNKVIHQGKVSTPQEVEDFGNKVYNEILFISKGLFDNFPSQVMDLRMEQDKIRLSSVPQNVPTAGTSGTYFFHLPGTNNPKTSLEGTKKFLENTLNLLKDVEHSNNMHQWYGSLGRHR